MTIFHFGQQVNNSTKSYSYIFTAPITTWASSRRERTLVQRLIGLRQQDMLALRFSNLIGKGIETVIQEARRGGRERKRVSFEWTPELREGIDQVLALPRPIRGLNLFCTRTGQPCTESGFQPLWQRAMKRAIAQGRVKTCGIPTKFIADHPPNNGFG